MGEPVAYFITFACYGARLHGDDRGSIERTRNGSGVVVVAPAPGRERFEAAKLVGRRAELDQPRRNVISATIQEVCSFRGWTLHALNVRTNHVHAVVTAPEVRPEAVMNQFKAWSTRRLREQTLASADERIWSRHGSTRYLWSDDAVVQAGTYVLEGQGNDLGGVAWQDETSES